MQNNQMNTLYRCHFNILQWFFSASGVMSYLSIFTSSLAICFSTVNNLEVEVSHMKKTPLEAEPHMSRQFPQLAFYMFILIPRVVSWAVLYSYLG